MDTTTLIIGVIVVLVLVGGFFLLRRSPSDVAEEIRTARTGTPLAGRLTRSRESLGSSLRAVFSRDALDHAAWEAMEEALIGADVGVEASTRVVERVRAAEPATVDAASVLLARELRAVLGERDRRMTLRGDPAIVLVVGVNGTGKTTSIAKIASRLRGEGHTPILGAADTFRAAADTQLRTWAERVGVDVVSGQEGGDPAAVAHDALAAAKSRGQDVVIVDTAGRLQNKANLMAELGKIRRVLERDSEGIGEVLLVLDATAGQNGLSQARQFTDTAGVTGIVLTKLDGTARGGIVVAIEEELGIPVKFIGVGEAVEDLIPFDPDEFIDALLADVD